ncbi:GRP family sugar transporter [Streptococcus macacae]|uniref:Sugar transport protein n=1 Tax=Streptococcus macacae NCTC 11558 TaxID=764298 RepID=G5JUR2_9STRE|nr:GRP family sugar transporter [Streptococcus macacae]EHJ53297.1 sugar transport protein [Streptococcus macacae NCTC 11558]SUN78876.1 glucose uptake family protein [Streptococcus macacae NCTC 11558]
MSVLIALLPALAWGMIPLTVSRVKGRPTNQILGTGFGAALIGLVGFLITGARTNALTFLLAMLSGAFWTIGQTGQFASYKRIGVSNTMPISTGFQLIGNSLIGVIIFGEWSGAANLLLGSLALLLIIIGIVLTAITGSNDNTGELSIRSQDILFLLATTIGYWVYSAFPKTVTGSAESLFFPQMLGILLGASLYALLTKNALAFRQKASWQAVLAGFVFSIGALSYIYSVNANGVAAAFVYSQLSVVISTLSGMYILGEKKQGRALFLTFAGLLLIVAGSILTGLI